MGPEIVFPGAAYISMAVGAAYNRRLVLATEEDTRHLARGNYHHHLRDLKSRHALVLDPTATSKLTLTMHLVSGFDQTRLKYKVRCWEKTRRGVSIAADSLRSA